MCLVQDKRQRAAASKAVRLIPPATKHAPPMHATLPVKSTKGGLTKSNSSDTISTVESLGSHTSNSDTILGRELDDDDSSTDQLIEDIATGDLDFLNIPEGGIIELPRNFDYGRQEKGDSEEAKDEPKLPVFHLEMRPRKFPKEFSWQTSQVRVEQDQPPIWHAEPTPTGYGTPAPSIPSPTACSPPPPPQHHMEQNIAVLVPIPEYLLVPLF
jgi:hypothetical protein